MADDSDSLHWYVATGLRWTPPPNWPEAPDGWSPPQDWRPDPTWGPPPPGWAFVRLSDCAADVNMPSDYRDEDLDRAIRNYLRDGELPLQLFVEVLGSVTEAIRSAFEVPARAGRAVSGHRDLALRSAYDATDLLEKAELSGRRAPFVFFACLQDAVSAVMMSGATALRNVDQIGEDLQTLFDLTVARVMAVMHEALRKAETGGARGLVARQALGEIDEVRRLVERAGKRMELGEGLQLLSSLEDIGRRIAAKIGVRY